jgi:hypothetical protein
MSPASRQLVLCTQVWPEHKGAGSADRRLLPAALAVLAVVAALLVASPGPASAGPGFPAGESASRTFTYEVRTRGTVYADVDVFKRVAAQTLNDRRGWSLGGSLRFREVASGGSFTLWLAAPSELPKFSSICSSQYSCRVGRNVVINDARWRTGTSVWPDVREYRHYVINHELGHWLGRGHAGCPGAGGLAPVMQQQSIGLQGCRTNTWPLASEKSAVASTWGVSVRSSRPDLYAIKQHGDAGTEVHVVDGAGNYAAWQGHFASIAGPTAPGDWDFAVADRNRDGVDDVVGIKRAGTSGKVEVHVLDGASGYRSWQLHVATVTPRSAPGLWSFDVDDTNGDGYLDVIGINRFGTDGRTTVHVLDGAANFSRYLLHARTPIPHGDTDTWSYAVGDHDRDGVPDLYAIKRRGASGATEVHVLDGATGFTSWSAHAVTPIPPADASWDFDVDDLDGDGWDEVYAIDRDGASGRTEVHVLADRTYASFAAGAQTPLPVTDGVPGWRFAVD